MNTTLIILIGIAILLTGIGYGKSKTWADKLRLMSITTTVAVLTIFIYYIVGCWKFLNIMKPPSSIYQLQIIPLFIIAYCLAATSIICFCGWKKGGFKKLKNPKETRGIIFGLIVGFVINITIELIIGLLGTCTTPEDVGFILGLIVGFIPGFIIGFLVGLLIGFSSEDLNENK